MKNMTIKKETLTDKDFKIIKKWIKDNNIEYLEKATKEKLSNLLLFQSSETAENEYTTLAEYKERMKEGQEFIYYAAGKDKAYIEKLPHMEGMKDKGFEVLYFTDRVDEFMVGMMRDYEEIKLHSILQADNEKTDKDSSKEENKEEISKTYIPKDINTKKNKKKEKNIDNYDLEDWQKELVKENRYDTFNFEEEELEDDDYYSDDDDE